ncbi:hypothetical protein [Acetobacter sp. A11-2]|uniref:hypothetical protein n=1 Tax=Acetobacter sp. A11-2 TaxID=3157859 RepID=UPI0032EC187A
MKKLSLFLIVFIIQKAYAQSPRVSKCFIDIQNNGAQMNGQYSDEQLMRSSVSQNKNQLTLHIPSGIWPGANNFRLPGAQFGNWFANVDGGIRNWPFYVWSPMREGIRVPYYANGLTSLSHDSWDSKGFVISRVDTDQTNINANRVMAEFNLVADTPNEGGTSYSSGIRNIDHNLILTNNFSGFANNVSEFTFDNSQSGFGSQIVGNFNKYRAYGNSWGWNQIDEMLDFSSINFGHPDFLADGVKRGTKTNIEYDMSGIGPEQPESTYNPNVHAREIMWIGLNDFIKGDKWQPHKHFAMHHIITVTDHDNKLWMYDSDRNGGETGAAQPDWPFDGKSRVQDGSITWNSLGKYHFDVGSVIGVGGPTDTRVGTLMYESGSQIYNAVIDMSRASFVDNITHVFARMSPDMYIDMSSDGTLSGNNLHLLGYDSKEKSLSYKVDGITVLKIRNNGMIISSSPIQLPLMTRKQIKSFPSPQEGMEIYSTDDKSVALYTKQGWKLLSSMNLP